MERGGWKEGEDEQFAAWLPRSNKITTTCARTRPRSDSDAFFAVVIIAYSIDFQQGVLERKQDELEDNTQPHGGTVSSA